MGGASQPTWLRILLEPVLCIGCGVGAFLLLHVLWPAALPAAVIVAGVLSVVAIALLPRATPSAVKSLIVWLVAGIGLELVLVMSR